MSQSFRHVMQIGALAIAVPVGVIAAVGCSGAGEESSQTGQPAAQTEIGSTQEAVATALSRMLCACERPDGSTYSAELGCGTYDCSSGSSMIASCKAVCGTDTVYQTECTPASHSWCNAPRRPDEDMASCTCRDGFRFHGCVPNTAEVQNCRTQTEVPAFCRNACSTHGGFTGSFTCTDNPPNCRLPLPDEVSCNCKNGTSLFACASYPGASGDQFVSPNIQELTKVCGPICQDLGGLQSAACAQISMTGCAVE